MNLHEYQAKQLFAEYGLPVPAGFACESAQEAVDAATNLGQDKWVVKCQVHAGGRGKAGGVKVAKSKEEVRAFAEAWLGKHLVTYQTDAKGQPVNKILVEACTDIAKELYLGAVVDRGAESLKRVGCGDLFRPGVSPDESHRPAPRWGCLVMSLLCGPSPVTGRAAS